MSKVLGGIALLLGLAPGLALASSEGGGGFINLDRSLLIQIVNFGLLLFFLWKFLYRPFLAKLDERSRAIKKALSEAQEAQAEAERPRGGHRQERQAAHAAGRGGPAGGGRARGGRAGCPAGPAGAPPGGRRSGGLGGRAAHPEEP